MILSYRDILFSNPVGLGPHGRWRTFFDASGGWCPHCTRSAPSVRSTEWERLAPPDIDPELRTYFRATAWKCTCGWWEIRKNGHVASDFGNPHYPELAGRAVLMHFDSWSRSLPLTVLKSELLRRGDALHHLHHTKMEQLVGDILEDFRCGCTVEYVGGRRNLGIDLLLIHGEQPFAVQVKRRMHDDTTEPVVPIQAFVTATQLAGIPNAIYVTSARRISSYGRQIEERVVSEGLLESFELIDGPRLLEMLRSCFKPIQEEPWQAHFARLTDPMK